VVVVDLVGQGRLHEGRAFGQGFRGGFLDGSPPGR